MKLQSLASTLVKVALLLLGSSVLFELWNRGGRDLHSLPAGFTQKRLSGVQPQDEPQKLLSPEGKLLFEGWDVNTENHFIVNYEQAKTPWLPQGYSSIKYRAWNFFMIYLPNYVVRIPIAIFNPACVVSVQVYQRQPTEEDILKTRLIQESLPHKCPEMDLHSVNLNHKVSHKDGDFTLDIVKD